MPARLHASEAQPVTFVELFFDLVFVFAVTQLTVLTAHHLNGSGIARSAVLFWLIWWAWTQFTWTLSPADTNHTVVRVCTLAATSAAFVMAASVPGAFGDEALWFAIPYVTIRLIGMGLQVRVDRERSETSGHISLQWVYTSLIGLAVVLAGALVSSDVRPWVWFGAIIVDFAASAAAGRNDAIWDLDPSHFSERHGLFVIIALGESLIVAASAIAEDERTADLVMAAGAALLVACLLWWTYFGWLKDALEHAFARAEEILLHPDEPASGDVIAALAVGVALFVGASAVSYWRLAGDVLVPRLAILAVTVGAVAALASADPVWPLSAVAVELFAIAIVEQRSHSSATDTVTVEVE